MNHIHTRPASIDSHLWDEERNLFALLMLIHLLLGITSKFLNDIQLFKNSKYKMFYSHFMKEVKFVGCLTICLYFLKAFGFGSLWKESHGRVFNYPRFEFYYILLIGFHLLYIVHVAFMARLSLFFTEPGMDRYVLHQYENILELNPIIWFITLVITATVLPLADVIDVVQLLILTLCCVLLGLFVFSIVGDLVITTIQMAILLQCVYTTVLFYYSVYNWYYYFDRTGFVFCLSTFVLLYSTYYLSYPRYQDKSRYAVIDETR